MGARYTSALIADHPLSIEADGMLTFVAREPHFDGTLNLSRPVRMAHAATQWRRL